MEEDTFINSEGYVYFGINTENENLEKEDFNSYLGIKPTNFEKKHARGKIPVTTNWRYSTAKITNPIIFELIEEIYQKLFPIKDKLISFKRDHPEVNYRLQVVFSFGDETPGLSIENHIVNFVSEIGGSLDCDLYNNK
ncbi:MAG: DUF4279 domain-containing protein [Saprospiraceae bacterium]